MESIVRVSGFSRVEAKCQEDPEIFFSGKSSDKLKAQKICSECPFKERCLRQAEEEPTTYGMWGGKFFTVKEIRHKKDMCRKGLHELPEDRTSNECKICKNLSQSRYRATAKGKALSARQKKRNQERKKNKIGGTCNRGEHVLTEANTKIRAYDNALMCIECLQSLVRVRFKTDTGERHARRYRTS